MSIFIKKIIKMGILGTLLFNSFNLTVKHQQARSENINFVQKTKPQKEEYKIVFDSMFAPFEYQESDSDKYVGIDVEIIDRISELFKVKIKKEFISFDSALNQLKAKDADGMIAGMSITEEREKFITFSNPYFESGLRIAVEKKNNDIKSFENLKNKKVGVKLGSAAKDFLEKNKDKYECIVEIFDEMSTMYQNLSDNIIDALIDDEPVLKYAIKQGKNFKLVGNKENAASYGFAVLKGKNEELVQMFNEALSYLRSTGELNLILDKYINQDILIEESQNKFLNLTSTDWVILSKGLLGNLVLIVIAFPISIIISIIFGLFAVSESKILKKISAFYINIARGIPLIILAFFIMYGLPKLFGAKSIDKYLAGIISLVLNASAYISEIIRGGILAISKGQFEASRSLGLSYRKTMQKIILPQAFKIMIPSLINQFIISLKDTTILQALGISEAMLAARNIVQRNFDTFAVYGVIALIFLSIITLLTNFAKIIEKKVRSR